MKIQARKCPFTGKVFEESRRGDYIKHLTEVRALQQKKRKEENIRSNFQSWLTSERTKVRTIEELAPWFLKNQRMLMDAHNSGIVGRYFSFDEKFVEEDIFENVVIQVGKFTECVSNSHVCPDKGVTNWTSKPDLPTGYPGWHGRISGKLTRSKKHNGSYPYGSAINLAGFKTGSGGGGNNSWSYDLSIFLDDWPGLQHQKDLEFGDRVAQRLKGKF